VPSPTRHRSQRRRRRTSEVGRAARLALAALLLIGAGACRHAPLPVLGTVPSFDLVERAGTPLRAGDLAGTVWVADFIFTRCPDFCPALTARMAELQTALAPRPGGLRLVSFSVDPEHDTPDVLRAYAARAGARDGWLFATGPRDRVASLLRDGFHVAYADDGPPTTPITHSDRLVLVDPALRIRGYYHGTDADDVHRLIRDARALAAEAPA